MHIGRAADRGRPRRRSAPRGPLRTRSPARPRGCGRFKTGTPPRLHRDSIDYARCARRSTATIRRVPFSFRTARIAAAAAGAVLADRAPTRASTTLIRENLASLADVLGPDPGHRPALLSFGRGQGRPVRREERAHDLPRARGLGRATRSTSTDSRRRCPKTCSATILAGIRGLEHARMLRPGYAVEYDFVLPEQLRLDARDARSAGTLSRRADQRHLGLRGSGGAGPVGGNQRRARRARRGALRPRPRARPTPRVMVDDLTDEGSRRAVPSLHVARRVPAAARSRHGAPAPGAPRKARSVSLDETEYARRDAAEERIAPRGWRAFDARVVTPTGDPRASCSTPSGSRSTRRRRSRNLLKRQDLEPMQCLAARPRGPSPAERRRRDPVLESRVRYDGYIRRERRPDRAARSPRVAAPSRRLRLRGLPGPLPRGRREVRRAGSRGLWARPRAFRA